VIAAGGAPEIDRYAAALLAMVEAELTDLEGTEVHLGVGEAVETIGDLAMSGAGARNAARLGRAMPESGPIVKWSELGAMRVLVELVAERNPGDLLPESLRRLLASPDGEQLTVTLEAYLEHAGDVPAAASDLFIHRSSLYNRLQRIEDIAGVDMRSGADRLELHIGIRLWRMSGHHSL